MSRPKAASRAAAANVAASLAALLSPARAEASRKNGARSRGPVTPEGKARSSRNALKHGLRAEKFVVVDGESAEAFAAFEAALVDDLAPEGALQAVLAGRIVARRLAARARRADRGRTVRARDGRPVRRRRPRPRADPRRQRRARVRHAAALSRRRPGRAFSHAAHAQGAPGRSRAQEAAPPRRAQAQLATPEQAPLAALPSKPEARGNPGELRCESGRAPGSQGPVAAPGPARLAAVEPALAAAPRVAVPARETAG